MVYIEILGKPIPQKQTQFTRSGHVYDPSSKDAAIFKAKVRELLEADSMLQEGPLYLCLLFIIEPPKSTSKSDRVRMLSGETFPTKKPDVDNLAYFVTNALKKILYEDDSQIVDMNISKKYGPVAKTCISISGRSSW